MQRILNTEQANLLQRERSLIEELRLQLTKLDASEDDLELLKDSLKQLDELFLLVVVGEFNAGKTAFLNAMLGQSLLKEGVTPTTDRIHLLRYGETQKINHSGDDFTIVQLPIDWLHEVNLVDTPGTNAVVQRHQQITEHFVPRSDLILFVTSADRPFSESERTFMENIRGWGKKIIIVINKIDLFEDLADRKKVIDFVREGAVQYLEFEPELFPISARLALRAKESSRLQNYTLSTDKNWQASQFEALETFVLQSLDESERIRLKLSNPLGVAERLLKKYREVIKGLRDILKGDFQTIDTIEEQLEAYTSDMRKDFKYHGSHVDNVLFEMSERGDEFFDEVLRLGRVFDLVNSEKLRGEFERRVVSDTSHQVERSVSEMIDWMVDKDYRQWRDVMKYLNERAAQHSDRIVGQLGSEFEFNRQNLLASIGQEAQRVVDSYDREAESIKLSQEVQRALLQTAAVEVGAIGLGALLVAILNTTLLDFTGILGAGMVAALGLYVLPYRRSKIKAELRRHINELRKNLTTAMNSQFETELNNSIQRVHEAIAPYTRFVRIEREKLEKLEEEFQANQAEIDNLRSGIENL